MSRALFEKKFGAELVPGAPLAPGVYQYLDGDGSVIYVGKAKCLRRRLSSYRNASRRRIHRKQRAIVRDAHALTYEICQTEEQALLRENELIRCLRPRFNVQGAYTFLYPFFGYRHRGHLSLLCLTTDPARFRELTFSWFGCFHSRPRAKLAFDALVTLLAMLAHREKVAQLPAYPRLRGSRVVGFRQMPVKLEQALPAFFSGNSVSLPSVLALQLLSKPQARRRAAEVQAHLRALEHFAKTDAVPLRRTLQRLGRTDNCVDQAERDDLFIRASFTQ